MIKEILDNEIFLEILEVIEFEYYLNSNGKIQLRDLQGANLGGIESDEFELDKDIYLSLLDRLEIYLIDYFLPEEYNNFIDIPKRNKIHNFIIDPPEYVRAT